MRHRLAALSSLFEDLCEKNAVTHNPVKGVKRPRAESGEGKTPALGDHQARDLLVAPGKDTAADEETIKKKRDRAILSTLLFHALRRGELCKLKVKDFRQARRGVPHMKVAGHGADENGALFRPIKNNRTGRLDKALTPDAVYRLVEDTWLDNWSAEKYVGTIFRDSGEAALVDVAVLRVLRIMHQVGADAPVSAYLEHHGWPEAVRAAREAHVRLAVSDGDDPDTVPQSLDVLRLVTRSA